MVKMSSIAAYISLHMETIITYTSKFTTSKYWKNLYPNINVLINYTSGEISSIQRNHYLQEVEYEHFDVQARVNKNNVADVYGRRLLDL